MSKMPIASFLYSPLLHAHEPIQDSMIGPLQVLKTFPLQDMSVIILHAPSRLQAALAADIPKCASP